jgi:integrase
MKRIHELELLPLFEKFIASSKSGKRRSPSGKRISNGAIIQYQMVYNLLGKFNSLQKAPIRIILLNSNSNRILQAESNYWKRFFRNFTDWLYQRKYFDVYVGAIAKILRTVFNYLKKDKCLNIGLFHLKFLVPSQNISPIVLDPEQLKYLISNTTFRERLSDKLSRTNDFFIFGSTVGLRFADLLRLKKSNIQTTADLTYLILNTSKTSSQIKVPLPSYALAILNKYRKIPGPYILPRISNTNFNLNIKELMEFAGWTYSLPKIRYRQGKSLIVRTANGKDFRFCDHITAHTMRRTAITTLLMLGVDEQIVRTISGHSPNSKEFYKYVALVQNHMNKQVINAFEKLLL